MSDELVKRISEKWFPEYMAEVEGDRSKCESAIREALEAEWVDVLNLIAAERERQISAEGWTPEHDDEHDGNQMAMAAACYASPVPLRAQIEVPCGCREAICPHSAFGKHKWVNAWPWAKEWDKRWKHGRIRQLVIAGALIVAEIERLKRAPAETEGKNG